MIVFREDILLPLVLDKEVLDCGGIDHYFGEGKRMRDEWLHSKIAKLAKRCVGVDILEDRVREINKEGEFTFLVANAENMSFSEEFDVVVAGEFIEHVYNAGSFLDSAWRALKPNGRLVLTTPNSYGLSGLLRAVFTGREQCHPEHTCYYSAQTLHYLVVHHGFELERLEHVERPAEKRAIGHIRRLVGSARPNLGEILVLVARKTQAVNKYADKW